jgi:hypothetical protein
MATPIVHIMGMVGSMIPIIHGVMEDITEDTTPITGALTGADTIMGTTQEFTEMTIMVPTTAMAGSITGIRLDIQGDPM